MTKPTSTSTPTQPPKNPKEGWSRAPYSELWHYFHRIPGDPEASSLCESYFINTHPISFRNDKTRGPNDCSFCWKVLNERHQKEPSK